MLDVCAGRFNSAKIAMTTLFQAVAGRTAGAEYFHHQASTWSLDNLLSHRPLLYSRRKAVDTLSLARVGI